MIIRKVTPNDANAICDIYNYYVVNSSATFETEPVAEPEMRQRIEAIIKAGFSYYVADVDGQIVGYSYLSNWHHRCAYSSTKEITVYLHKDYTGKDLGTILYQHLLRDAYHEQSIHSLIGVIALPNDGSVRLHEKMGFKQVSHLKEVGYKLDKWQDIGHWQLIKNQIPPRILILCTGNSCRSQMAHGFLQSFDARLLVYSAGTKASGKLNQKAVGVMEEIGIDISHHTSDSVETYLSDEWDYVITVCGGANESCPAFAGKVKHRLHIGFDDPSDAEGTPEFIHSEFVRVRDQIKKAFYELYTSEIE